MEGECKGTMFQNIKQFFAKIFNKQKKLNEGMKNVIEQESINKVNVNSDSLKAKSEPKNTVPSFFQEAQENRKYEILKQQFSQRKIKEEAIAEEDKKVLRQMYYDEIEQLKKKKYNLRMKKIIQDKEIMAVFDKFKKGEIKEEGMTEEQKDKIKLLYNIEIENLKNRLDSLKKKQAV
jgi:hypothetical protein